MQSERRSQNKAHTFPFLIYIFFKNKRINAFGLRGQRFAPSVFLVSCFQFVSIVCHYVPHREFLEQQKARKIEIVARILKEEGQVEKMKAQSRLQESKDPDKVSDAVKWRMKTWRYIEETCSDKVAPVTQVRGSREGLLDY